MGNTDLDNYIENHTSPEDSILLELNRETHLKALMPRMLSGHLQGQILKLLSKMIRPTKILELGTYTGYSALCLASGLTENGILHTIEQNDELKYISDKYFKKSKYEHQIIPHIGDALTVMNALDTDFDLIFIDADKRQYPEYYELAMKHLKIGGFIIADNVLWSGKVVAPLTLNDQYTKGIIEFNKTVQNDPRTDNAIFPVRDGLMILQKTKRNVCLT